MCHLCYPVTVRNWTPHPDCKNLSTSKRYLLSYFSSIIRKAKSVLTFKVLVVFFIVSQAKWLAVNELEASWRQSLNYRRSVAAWVPSFGGLIESSFFFTFHDPDIFWVGITPRKMKKFFDSRRDMVNSGPAFGVSGGGSGSGGGGSFIGRVFTVGRFQVTVEEVVAEGKLWNFS